MTTFAPLDTDITPSVRRDGIGRYKIASPSGKLVGYTRATTIASTLDDKQGLIPWHARMTVAGLARSATLRQRLDVVDINDKGQLSALEAEAFEVGGGNAKRDLGSHLHHVAEMWWTEGVPPTDPTEAAWLDRVLRALDAAELTVVPGMCERVVVDDERKIAGTVDLFVKASDGRICVADIKTGSVQQIPVAIQLAIYAQAPHLYTFGPADSGADDTREPNDCDTSTGYVVHAPSDADVCTIEKVDLSVGSQLLDLALKVREARRSKPCSTVLSVDDTAKPEPSAVVLAAIPDAVPLDGAELHTERVAWLRGRADVIRTHEGATLHATTNWPADCPPLTADGHTPDQLDAIAAVFTAAEALMGAAFPERDPEAVASAATIAPDDPRVIEATRHYDGLPVDLQAELVDQVHAERRIPALTSGRATEADYELMRRHLDAIMGTHAQRIQSICDTLSLSAALDDVLVEVATGGRTTVGEQMTAVDVAHLDKIIDAINIGWLVVADDGSLTVDLDAAVRFAGTKRDLLKLSRDAAKAHGFDRPASSTDAVANLRLMAAVAVA